MFKIRDVKRFFLGLMPLFLVPSIYALDANVDLREAVEVVFGPQGLGGILQSTWGNYGLTIIFYYLLFYAVYASAMRRVKIFEGEGGLGLSKAGMIFVHAITGLTMLAIFAFKDASQSFIQSVLSPMGIFGGIVLATVFFLLIYHNWRDSNMKHPGAAALAATGLLMLVFGELVDVPTMAAIGTVVFFIGIIAWIVGFARSHGAVTPADERAGERAEEMAERELGREARQERPIIQEVAREEQEERALEQLLDTEMQLARQAHNNVQSLRQMLASRGRT